MVLDAPTKNALKGQFDNCDIRHVGFVRDNEVLPNVFVDALWSDCKLC